MAAPIQSLPSETCSMLRRLCVLVAQLTVAVLVAAGAHAQPAPDPRTAVVLSLDGIVGPATADYLIRGLAAAREQEAAVVVLRIDTPGGLDASMRDIIHAILASPVPVIAYVWAPVPVAAGEAQEPPADPAATVRAFIAEIVGRVVRSAAERPWLPALWLHEVVNEGGQLRERVLRHLPSDRLHAFAGLIADSQRHGAITPGVEPRLVFLSILGLTLLPLATSSLWRRVLQGDAQAQSIDTQTIATHAIAMLTGGLFSPSAPPGR